MNVWDETTAALKPANSRPTVAAGLVHEELETAQGEQYVIIQNPERAAYLRVGPDEFFLVELMDGSRTVQELVVQYMMRYKKFALPRVERLVSDLRRAGFLTDSPRPVWGPLQRAMRPQRVSAASSTLATSLLRREFPIAGVDRLVGRAYDRAGWLLFTRPGKLLCALVTLVGTPLLVWRLRHGPPLAAGSLTLSLPLYYVTTLVVALAHEAGHAFAVKAHGRIVRKGGLAIFYLSPSLFVDTQDIWMESRRARMVVSWAGPYSGFILAGVAGIAATLSPAGSASAFVWTAAGLSALTVNVFQLMPLIQLDGYYLLMDWLEMPNLRTRSFDFVRHELWGKVRRRERFNREDRALALFGVAATAYLAYFVSLGTSFAWVRASHLMADTVNQPSVAKSLIAVWLIVLMVPFAFVTLQRGQMILKTLRSAGKRAALLAGEARYRERVRRLSELPAIAGLGRARVQWLARRMRARTVRRGKVVQQAGDRSPAFHLVVSGRLEVLDPTDGGPHIVATLGPGDYFPEAGDLLAGRAAPFRVRAAEQSELLRLRPGDAAEGLGGHVHQQEVAASRLSERVELDGFAFLDGLSGRDKDALLSALRHRDVPVGTVLQAIDAAADAFYLVRQGTLEVQTPDFDGVLSGVRTVGAGEYCGETALLLGIRGAEQFVALTDCVVWELDAARFGELLCRYFGVGDGIEAATLDHFGESGPGGSASRGRFLDVAVGEEAPDFELPSVQGPTVRLSQLRGRPVLVWFSRGFNCPFCREYMARLIADKGRFDAAGVQLLQVAPNLLDSARAFWAKGTKHIDDLPFPFLCDPEKRAYLLCGVADLGAAEAKRNTVKGFAKAFAVKEGTVTCKAIALDVVNRNMGERFRHHALTASQQAVFVIDAGGRVAAKYLFGPLDELPSTAELLAAASTAVGANA